jgi:ubiquinone/menaquinone biosynthesis C-methylase UbiE
MHPKLKHYAKRILGRPTVPPPVDGVADAKWYDAAYRALEHYTVDYWQSHYYFLWSVLADRIRTAGSRSVLDIGCGPGQFASCLFGLTGIQEYTGMDFSAEAVAMAKRVCERGRFVVGDATTTTIHQEIPHDVVVCTEVLEHVPSDHEVVVRFRPGVRCLCTVPNFDYDSHVRYFTSADDVAARYGRFFERLDVWALRANQNHIYYLMDGIRNANLGASGDS